MHYNNIKNFIFFVLSIFFAGNAAAQEFVIAGQVIEKTGKIPISGVNLYLKNTEIGASTDENGYFMLRHNAESNRLVVSCTGFVTQEIKFDRQFIGITVELTEKDFSLPEIFVMPGYNPAVELMRKVRMGRAENNVMQKSWYSAAGTVQSVILIDRINKISTNRRIFEQIKTGNLSQNDTSLVIPVFMIEKRQNFLSEEVKTIDENIFSSNPKTEKIARYLTGQIPEKINFYKNNIILFDKSMISPLSSEGSLFYNYYLADSALVSGRKIYELHFHTRNRKNLAFSGTLKIDSATLAITGIAATLPAQANINFINGLHIEQKFKLQNEKWMPETENVSLRMTYELLADSIRRKPEIFIGRNTVFSHGDSLQSPQSDFARSGYNTKIIEQKLEFQNNMPVVKLASWLADVIFTGYIPAGIFDFGKIQNFVRFTQQEGVRLTLPLRTNEKLWKNMSAGGYLGYGLGDKSVDYQSFIKYRLPSTRFRTIGISYTRDYRKTDYDYNDFLFRENPLRSGDEDISTSWAALKNVRKLNRRHEFEISLFNEWNDDFESQMFFRSNKIFMENTAGQAATLHTRSFTLSNRFSFGEYIHNDHIQRLYSTNASPVIYCILDGGKYAFDENSGFYGKISVLTRHSVYTSLGKLRYIAEAGKVFGKVPYPLLEIPTGRNGRMYSLYRFGLMNRMEYAADIYASLHTEMTFNGIVLNRIPLVKHLNFREIVQFKAFYGHLNDANMHNLSDGLVAPQKPYAEIGVGIANILRFLSLQYVWRLGDLQKSGINKSCLQVALLMSF